MPDEVATPAAAETPVADALSGAAPAEAPEEGTEAPAEGQVAPPARPAAPAPDPAVVELARKLAQDANLPEHKALREERRKLKAAMDRFGSERGTLEQQVATMQAELAEATANPFAYAAKKRGKSESDIYNERTLRAVDPQAAELDEVKRTIEQERQERQRERAEQQAREAQANVARVQHAFASEVIHIATTEKEFRYIQLGLEEGEYQPQNVANEVMRRVKEHHARTFEENDGEGEILDSKEVLKKIESELREEAKRKAARLAKLETAGQSAIPDREGAVEPATHEANRSSGPRTLTNALASQTSGTKRKLTRRETMLEADKLLRR